MLHTPKIPHSTLRYYCRITMIWSLINKWHSMVFNILSHFCFVARPLDCCFLRKKKVFYSVVDFFFPHFVLLEIRFRALIIGNWDKHMDGFPRNRNEAFDSIIEFTFLIRMLFPLNEWIIICSMARFLDNRKKQRNHLRCMKCVSETVTAVPLHPIP